MDKVFKNVFHALKPKRRKSTRLAKGITTGTSKSKGSPNILQQALNLVTTGSTAAPANYSDTVDYKLPYCVQRLFSTQTPTNVNCVAYDNVQKVLAVGENGSGTVRVYGHEIDFTLHCFEQNDKEKEKFSKFSVIKLSFVVNIGLLLGVGVTEQKDANYFFAWDLKNRQLFYRFRVSETIVDIYSPADTLFCYLVCERVIYVMQAAEISFAPVRITPALSHWTSTQPKVEGEAKEQAQTPRITCIAVNPFDDHLILVGFENGMVCLENAFNFSGSPQTSACYLFQYSKHKQLAKPVTASCVCWCPTVQNVFVVGYSNGDVIVWSYSSSKQGIATVFLEQPVQIITNFSGCCVAESCWVASELFLRLNLSPQETAPAPAAVKPGIRVMQTDIKGKIIAEKKSFDLNSNLKSFGVLSSQTPFQKDQKKVRYGYCVFNNGSLKILDLESSDGLFNVSSLHSNFIPKKVRSIENFVQEKLISKPLKNTEWPITGGKKGYYNGSSIVFDMIMFQFEPGVLSFWGAAKNCSEFIKICELGQQAIEHFDLWTSEALVVCSKTDVYFVETRTFKQMLLPPHVDTPVVAVATTPFSQPSVAATAPVQEAVTTAQTQVPPVVIAPEQPQAASNVTISPPVTRTITAILCLPIFNQLVVGYSNSEVEVHDISEGTLKTKFKVAVDQTMNYSIVAIQVGSLTKHQYKNAPPYEKERYPVLFVSSSSGKLQLICLITGKVLSDITLASKALSIYSLDDEGNNCVFDILPTDELLPPFMRSSERTARIINFNTPRSLGKQTSSEDKTMKNYTIRATATTPQQVLIYPLVVELTLNRTVDLLDPTITVAANKSFYLEFDAMTLIVGHTSQNQQIRVSFDLSFDVNLSGAKRIIVIHDFNEKKYEVYHGKKLIASKNYDGELPEAEIIDQVDVSVQFNEEDEKKLSHSKEEQEEFLFEKLDSINIYYRHFKLTAQKLHEDPPMPSIHCEWYDAPQDEQHSKYLLVVQEDRIGVYNHLPSLTSLMKTRNFKTERIIDSQIGLLGTDDVLATLDSQGTFRIYSIPDLKLMIKQNLSCPSIMGSTPPLAFRLLSAGRVLFTGAGKAVVAVIQQPDQSVVVHDPQVYVEELDTPEKSRNNNNILNQIFSAITASTNPNFSPKLEELYSKKDPGLTKSIVTDFHKPSYKTTGEKRTVASPFSLMSDTEQKLFEKQTPKEDKWKQLLEGADKPSEGSSSSATSEATKKVNEVKNAMNENLQMLNERGEKMTLIQEKSSKMANFAKAYAEATEKMKQKSKPFGGLF